MSLPTQVIANKTTLSWVLQKDSNGLYYTEMGGVRVYFGTGIPEGEITAPKGSIFVNVGNGKIYSNHNAGTGWSSKVNVVKAVFDTAGNDSAGVSNKTIAAHPLGSVVPDDAIIVGGLVDVITTFADGVDDSATIALKVQDANDLVAAISIATAGDVWDAGVHGVLPGNFISPDLAQSAIEMAAARAASQIKTTAEREITATVAVHALTAGKLNLYLYYVMSEVVV